MTSPTTMLPEMDSGAVVGIPLWVYPLLLGSLGVVCIYISVTKLCVARKYQPSSGGTVGMTHHRSSSSAAGDTSSIATGSSSSNLQDKMSSGGTGTPSSSSTTTSNAAMLDDPLKFQGFLQFQKNYLVVYLLCTFSDWLKGPYVYALYEVYGFNKHEIAWLFIMGFASSLVFGTSAGALSDRFGRKLLCQVFCVVYAMSALTKMVNNFWVLLLGRALSGIATSLLFTTFEAWMVSEHNSRGYPQHLLTDTLSRATAGNGCVAILAGLVAQFLASQWGYVMPFMAAVPCLFAALVFMGAWPENYGGAWATATSSPSSGATGSPGSLSAHGTSISSAPSSSSRQSASSSVLAVANHFSTISKGMGAIMADSRLRWLGLSEATFEGCMYVWVFYWTPALAASPEAKALIPYGLVFACFMAAFMIGGFAPSFHWGGGGSSNIDWMPLPLHSTSLFATALSAYFYDNKLIVLGAFVMYEATVGAYFPVHGTIRSRTIDESTRAAVMSLFRVPLNLYVILLLQFTWSTRQALAILALTHTVSTFSFAMYRKRAAEHRTQ